MNLAAQLARAGRRYRQAAAVAHGTGNVLDYGGLAGRAARLAAALNGRVGLAPGDRVALAMTNCPHYIEVLYGCWWAGLVVVPMNAKLHAAELGYMLENSGARLCFATPTQAQAIGAQIDRLPALARLVEVAGRDYDALFAGDPVDPRPRAPDDLAWLFYTSGTTGRPKGAMLSHRNLTAMALSYFVDVDHIVPGDSILHAAPLSHGSGLYVVPHVMAAACQVVPESGGFEPAEIFDLLRGHRGVTCFFAPTMVKRLIEHPAAAPHPNLKTLVYGGGPMYVENLKRAMSLLGNVFVQIYGQGESPMTITALSRSVHADQAHPRYAERLASVGCAHSVVDLRLADSGDRSLPPGELGEILVRGDSVMRGYWQNPAASEETLRDGWLHTGDMGVLDEDGYLTLKDRSKDVIISGGANIYPREIEEVLQAHDAVAECAVIGRTHPDWGEEVVAFVVACPGAQPSPEALEAHCLSQIARFKRPKVYRFVESLPKNNYGKVLKTVLRDWALKAEPPEAAG